MSNIKASIDVLPRTIKSEVRSAKKLNVNEETDAAPTKEILTYKDVLFAETTKVCRFLSLILDPPTVFPRK